MAKKIFGTLAGRKILLIGAGEMAELTGTHLISSGAEDIIIANRSPSQAVQWRKNFMEKLYRSTLWAKN
jgi:Glutamyl-tRNA reductase